MRKSIIRLSICVLLIISCATTGFAQRYNQSRTYTWYSQLDSGTGTTWNSYHLDNLYLPNMSSCSAYCDGLYKCANTPLYTTSSYTPNYNQLNRGHINKFGCSITSAAMVFKNLNATTSSSLYDFRSHTTTHQQADPFTVSMANIGWPQVSYNSNLSRYEMTSYTSSSSPEYAYWYTIASAFGLTPHIVYLTNYTTSQKADALAQYINNHSEGILVRVSSSHTLVFTGTTHSRSGSIRELALEDIEITAENEKYYVCCEHEFGQDIELRNISVTSTIYDSEFTCYDPGTTNSSKGMGITYNNSWTASYYGGIDQINYIVYFD